MDTAELRRLLAELDDCRLAGEEEAVLYHRVWLRGLRDSLPALLDAVEAAEERDDALVAFDEHVHLCDAPGGCDYNAGGYKMLCKQGKAIRSRITKAEWDLDAALAALKEAE